MLPDNRAAGPASASTVDAADAEFAEWMRENLHHAADQFGLSVTGPAVSGWRLRTIGAPTTGADGPRWLRVASEFPQWAGGPAWTGNADANLLTGLAKPQVLDLIEWDDHGWRRQRAEVMTLLPGRSVSPTAGMAEGPVLAEGWWTRLRRDLDVLRATPTSRRHTDQDAISARTRAVLGAEIRIDAWETVHGDLHWNNLLAPELGILDWELWGIGPAGTDAASLLLFSLTAPAVAARVHATFADLLDTEHGRRAQLAVAARLLTPIASGDFPGLAEPLHRHIRGLGATAG